MTRLLMLIALLFAPASGWAQEFSAHFDSDVDAAYAAEAPQPAQPAIEAGTAAGARARSVRYAQRSVRMVPGTSPMAAELDMTRLPQARR